MSPRNAAELNTIVLQTKVFNLLVCASQWAFMGRRQLSVLQMCKHLVFALGKLRAKLERARRQFIASPLEILQVFLN
jgi:hypothetical protein